MTNMNMNNYMFTTRLAFKTRVVVHFSVDLKKCNNYDLLLIITIELYFYYLRKTILELEIVDNDDQDNTVQPCNSTVTMVSPLFVSRYDGSVFNCPVITTII